MTFPTSLEPLEDRLTPSALLPVISGDGKTATFVDADGDVFNVTTSKGKFIAANFTYGGDELTGQGYLQKIDLSFANYGKMFEGAKLTVSVDQFVGDGYADVGFIDASGVDLRQAAVDGDLVKINVGDANVRTPAIGLLHSAQLGFHTIAEAGLSDFTSHVVGRISRLEVGDWANAAMDVNGDGTVAKMKYGSIGSVFIGSLTGGTDDSSGSLFVAGNIGTAVILGSIQGGEGTDSGTLKTYGYISSLSVGGSVIGSDGNDSGTVSAVRIRQISIGGDVTYGVGGGGGFQIQGPAGSATIGGDMSGFINAWAIRSVFVAGDFTGNVDAYRTLIKFEAGSISGGVINSTGVGARSFSISKVIVHGNVENAQILAGLEFDATPIEPNARIGLISIGGNLTATDIVAGIDFDSSSDPHVITPDAKPGYLSSIGKIIVTGAVEGSTEIDAQNWILAERIGTVSIGGVKLPLNPRGLDTQELGTMGNYRLMEVRA